MPIEFPRQRQMKAALHKHCTELSSTELDVGELARKFGVSTKGLDLPKKVRLLSLYSGVLARAGLLSNSYSMALGLRRSPADVKGGVVQNYWDFADGPERGYGLLEGLIGREALRTEDVTCYAKFHLVVPRLSVMGFGKPSLVLNPVQKVMLKEKTWEARQELEARSKNSSSRKRHQTRWKLSTLDKSVGDVFNHRDRHLVMALLALELAQRLEVKKIVLPSGKQIRAWERLLAFKRDSELMPPAGKPRVGELYAGVKKILDEAGPKNGVQIIQK